MLGALLAGVATVWWLRGDGGIDLGDVSRYAPGSVTYRSTDGFFVVRAPDGSVLALSDFDPHNPPGRKSCVVTFRPDLTKDGDRDDTGRFFDLCTGSTYDRGGRGESGDRLDLRRIRIELREDGRLRALPAAPLK